MAPYNGSIIYIKEKDQQKKLMVEFDTILETKITAKYDDITARLLRQNPQTNTARVLNIEG